MLGMRTMPKPFYVFVSVAGMLFATAARGLRVDPRIRGHANSSYGIGAVLRRARLETAQPRRQRDHDGCERRALAQAGALEYVMSSRDDRNRLGHAVGHRHSEDQSLRKRIDDRSDRDSLATSRSVTLVLLGRALSTPFSIPRARGREPRVDERKQEGADQKGDRRARGSCMLLSRNGELRDGAQEGARAERHRSISISAAIKAKPANGYVDKEHRSRSERIGERADR